jgi:hypothetical protein
MARTTDLRARGPSHSMEGPPPVLLAEHSGVQLAEYVRTDVRTSVWNIGKPLPVADTLFATPPSSPLVLASPFPATWKWKTFFLLRTSSLSRCRQV